MTKPEKQDGTMELDMSQIDLLDLPLPPSSKASLPQPEHHHLSKGPPPLPPSLPPETPDLVLPPTFAKPADANDDLPVPSLALPEHSISRPSHATPPPAAISARKLVDGPPAEQKSSVVRFLLGMGAASLVCVAIFVAYRTFHKTTPGPSPSATASAAPTHAFTMAPIEFTASSSDEPTASASATPPPPATTTTARSNGGAATTAAPRPTQTSGTKPPRTDEVIKVEN